MSINSTSANYGGKIGDQQQTIKQFIVGSDVAPWIYKKSNNIVYQTPSNPKLPVLINNDLTVTGSIYNASDSKLKTNVSSISSQTADIINELEPVSYNWKYAPFGKKKYGFLAQNVEMVYPNLVNVAWEDYTVEPYQTAISKMNASSITSEQTSLIYPYIDVDGTTIKDTDGVILGFVNTLNKIIYNVDGSTPTTKLGDDEIIAINNDGIVCRKYYKTIDYIGIIPLLVKKINTMQTTINQLQETVTNLTS